MLDLRLVGDQIQHRVFQIFGVGEVEAFVDTDGDDLRPGLDVVAQHIAIDFGMRNPPDDGQVRLAGAPDEDQQRDRRADQNAPFDAGQQDRDEGDDQRGSIALVVAPDMLAWP